MKILIRPLHRRYAAEPPRRGSREMRRLNCLYQKTSYAESNVQNIYTTFYNNTNNQKRKLKRCPEALEKYNVRFNELKEKALTMKRGLSDDSPMSEVLAYSEQLLDWETELRDLADQLHENMENT